ncbi:claspin-like [Nylanderia fulva]|uniref:claspin-like n=1 Tax=Nylanderia fulva TaxID=613905 RepID=UPI0010FB04F6|nr:claspin-like [Nylanderia fulva]
MEVNDTEELNDEKCILVEFPNENGNIAVGYFAWLTTVKEEERVNALIKSGEHVVIRWPANCIVGPLNAKMKKKFLNCKWTPHIVSILGFGDWTSMNTQLKNYLKYDEPNPTKEDRKKYAAKKKGSSSSEEDDKKKELKDTNKRRTSAAKKVAGNILEKIKKKDQSQSEAQSVTRADSDSTSSSDDDCAISMRTLSTSHNNKIKFTEETVSLRKKNRALEAENLKLKEENKEIKIASAKDLKDIKDMTTTILRLLKVNERETKKQNVDNLHKERAEDNAQKIVFDGFIDSFDPPINEDSLNDDYAVFRVPYKNKTIVPQDDNEIKNRVLKTVETKRDEKRQLMTISSNENKLKVNNIFIIFYSIN